MTEWSRITCMRTDRYALRAQATYRPARAFCASRRERARGSALQNRAAITKPAAQFLSCQFPVASWKLETENWQAIVRYNLRMSFRVVAVMLLLVVRSAAAQPPAPSPPPTPA